MPEFAGIKTCADKGAARRPWGVHHVRTLRSNGDRLELLERGTVGWGGNSGFHCLNLAAQLNPAKIVLVGFDMRLDRGVHWHGPHVALNNPHQRNMDRWRAVIDAAAETLEALGIVVFNTSEISMLQNYRKTSLAEAFAC